jgi:hypothetical protein
MEEAALNYTSLISSLNGFINDFMNTYKSLLMRDGKKASGNLINSIRNVDIAFQNGEITGEISLASYWKYVEYGRRPGKFPPLQNILDWIKIKPVIPRPVNGLKAPSEKQLAFLISRKIAKDGIKAGNQLQEALDITWNKWENTLSQSISEDIQRMVDMM